MFIPDSSDEFVPILCKYEDGKEVDNDLLKSKTLGYTGYLHNCFKGKCVVMKSVSSSSDRESGEEELAKWLFCASNVLVAIKEGVIRF